MKINFNMPQNKKSPAFQARNAEIRFADDIMRRVNNAFPRLSLTKIYDLAQNKNKITPKQITCINSIEKKIQDLRNIRPSYLTHPIEYLKLLLYSVKILKVGDCGESASLSKAGFAVNGIKGAKVGLYGYDSKNNVVHNFDHSLFIVNLADNADLSNPKTYGKRAYLVDAWMGNVDYISNAFKKLKNEHEDVLKDKKIRLGIKIEDFNMNEDTIKLVQKAFPKLKMDKQ